LAYPGFSAFFFDALKCRKIDGRELLIADLAIACSGPDYALLPIVAIVCVVFWCFGLPMLAMVLLWPERSNLLRGHKPSGWSEHLHDLYAPYKPQYWFFESIEYGKKLFLIGVVPVISGNLVGAVIALLITGAYLLLLTALSPFTHKSDHVLAVCTNSLLSMVILISVLLKMNAAYLAGTVADGINPDAATVLLVASNALVVVLSVAAYVVSARQAAQNEKGHRHDHSSLQEPLLRSGAHSTGGDEGDIAEAGGDRELPMSAAAAAESTQSSSASSSSSDS
jgi:hypothetical protein